MQTISLVDHSKYPAIAKQFNESNFFLKKKKWWNINKILLVGFIVFTIFFLYNCRFGIFRYDKNILTPFAYTSTGPA